MTADGPSDGTTEAAGKPNDRQRPGSVADASIATRRLDGVDLATHIRRGGALAPTTALLVLRPVAEALDAAHRRGLVHGHVRPRNIVLAGNGHVRLAGFGERDEQASPHDAAFIAPEQVEGRRGIGPRTDVYGLGCVLYTCITARLPFDGSTDEVLGGHLEQAAPRPSRVRPGLPRGVDAVIARALAKRPQERFGSCVELIDAFAACMDSPIGQVRRRPPPVERTTRSGGRSAVALGLAVVAALSMVTMTFAAGFWNRPDAAPETPAPPAQPTDRPASSAGPSARPTAVPRPSPSTAPSMAPPSDVPATPATLPTASVADASVQGGGVAMSMEFVVSLSQTAGEPVTVEYATQDGTAIAGIDYTASTGTLEIRPGVTSAVIRVPVLANTDAEPDETFSVQLQSVANAALGISRATGTIRAPQPNRPPVCEPRAVSVPAGGSNHFSANCLDPDGNPLSLEIVSQATRGTARVRAGKLRYEAYASAFGSDSFTYRASDGQLTSEPATVTITITGAPQPNRSPICEDRSMSVPVGGSDTVRPTCSDPDGDPLTFQIVAQGVNGVVEVTDNGRLRYTANPGATGSDTFVYRASDGALQSGTASVNVTIGAPAP